MGVNLLAGVCSYQWTQQRRKRAARTATQATHLQPTKHANSTARFLTLIDRERVAREGVPRECVPRECVSLERVSRECVSREPVARECVAREFVPPKTISGRCLL